MPVEEPTGTQAVMDSVSERHPVIQKCGKPWCSLHDRADLSRTALIELVSTFEICNCPIASYSHLVEQLWHRKCFVGWTESRS